MAIFEGQYKALVQHFLAVPSWRKLLDQRPLSCFDEFRGVIYLDIVQQQLKLPIVLLIIEMCWMGNKLFWEGLMRTSICRYITRLQSLFQQFP